MDQGSDSPIHTWVVSGNSGAIRLDAFVRRCLPHLSIREARKAIAGGAFWINGRLAGKGERLYRGDVLTFRGSPALLEARPLPATDLRIPILYEDELVLALDKPAGTATHGFSGRERNSLANFLAASRPSLRGVGRSPWEAGIVHRLDRDTSGVILVAKEQRAFENLRSQFRHGSVKKKYWGLVWGRTRSEGYVDYSLAHDAKDRRKMKALIQEGMEKEKRWKARSHFRRLSYARGFSFIEIEIATGVTHQIRVHMGAIGHPIAGDPLYAGAHPSPLRRQFLHAFHIEFRHPGSGMIISIQSPLPEDLKEVLEKLGIKV